MRHVRQQEKNGCAIASLAMVTGMGYWEVRDQFGSRPNEEEGLLEWETASFLAEHGYAIAPKDRQLRSTIKRATWPPKPFAPVHLVIVKVFPTSSLTHMVVMLHDGSILDPEVPDKSMTFEDYHDVLYVAGVFNVSALSAA